MDVQAVNISSQIHRQTSVCLEFMEVWTSVVWKEHGKYPLYSDRLLQSNFQYYLRASRKQTYQVDAAEVLPKRYRVSLEG